MRSIAFIFFLLRFTICGAQTISPTFICSLPNSLNETSGIIVIDSNYILTHNDSGDTTRFFLYHVPTCSIEKEIFIDNYTMKDFEAITKDDSGYVYLGDFGNNLGSRIDLCILKIHLNDIFAQDTVVAQKIFFSYGDQQNFTSSSHNFDCESMFHLNDTLYLFSKNYGVNGNYCKRYSLSDVSGNYTIYPKDSISLPSWVTDAAIDTVGKKFVLQSETSIYQFNYIHSPQLDTIRKIFNYSFISKKEGISFQNENVLLLTDEYVLSVGGNLYQVDINSFLNYSSYNNLDFINVIHDENKIRFKNSYPTTLRIQIYNLNGEVVLSTQVEPDENFEYSITYRGILLMSSEDNKIKLIKL